MTIPFFVQEPITLKQVQVPYDILNYCDTFTVDANREDLRYIDCVYMHMGFYGNDPKKLKQYRVNHVKPVFD